MNSFKIKLLQIVVLIVIGVLLARLLYIQVIDNSYKMFSNNNVLKYNIQYPPRGEILDRNGEFLAQSKEAYDLLVIPREINNLDTLQLCETIGVDLEQIRSALDKAKKHSSRRPSIIFKQLNKETKMRFDERKFNGFYTQFRTVRSYPRKVAGNLLGYVGEVNDKTIEINDYYKSGDYIGMSGVEYAYEEILRGEKGVRVEMVDVHGITKGSYANGKYDTIAIPGLRVKSTIDVRLQVLGEELLAGKVGSIVAIEPATGEILLMASSPTYDPDQLVGRERGNNYMKLLGDSRNPLFNRAVMARYPPGSTFKIINGLIGLQEGVLTPETRYSCSEGYHIGRGVKCHRHWSPLPLSDAVQTSCNAYFCYVFRNIIDNRKYGSVKKGYKVWENYVESFGFGRKLDSDFNNELKGNVPTAEFYDKRYNGSWNSLTVLSLAIGQGELGVSPLQMANLCTIIANRGFYYIPHVIKDVEGLPTIDPKFKEQHKTMVDAKHFDPFVDGMWKCVHVAGGTGSVARVEGLNICGKTGTAQNPHGKDHSTFMAFAPRNNPRIAVSVYIENGGFGATSAAPIASLIIEQYLNDTIKRPELVERIKNMQIAYPYYDRKK